jgi:hypothetical protein
MKILVACEESGAVSSRLIASGHNVTSCDLQSSSHPAAAVRSRHIQGDVLPLLAEQWDLVIAFPPCTDLASSGARWFAEKRANGSQRASIDFFLNFTALTCPYAIENPIGIMSTQYRKPDQIIHPWQFGHGETKATCLWLHGLKPLTPTNVVNGRNQRIWKLPESANRAKIRSKTFDGIANAMASQWT